MWHICVKVGYLNANGKNKAAEETPPLNYILTA